MDYHCNTIVVLLSETNFACLKEKIKNTVGLFCVYGTTGTDFRMETTEKFQHIVEVH